GWRELFGIERTTPKRGNQTPVFPIADLHVRTSHSLRALGSRVERKVGPKPIHRHGWAWRHLLRQRRCSSRRRHLVDKRPDWLRLAALQLPGLGNLVRQAEFHAKLAAKADTWILGRVGAAR